MRVPKNRIPKRRISEMKIQELEQSNTIQTPKEYLRSSKNAS
jgi:hypothetical protein